MSQSDQILDVRVRVPHGFTVRLVTAYQDADDINQCVARMCTIEGIYPAIDRDPESVGAVKPFRTGDTIYWLGRDGMQRCVVLLDEPKTDVLAGMAAKIDELVERLDGTDRRVAAINQGVQDAGDLLLKHEDAIEAVRLRGQQAGINLAKRIEAISNALQGTDHEGENVKRRLDAHDETLREHAQSICHTREITYIPQGSHAGRFATIEAALAKLEDAFTSDRRLVDLGTGELLVPNHPEVMACGNPACGQCYSPRKSLGWVNVYRNAHVCGPYPSRGTADSAAVEHARLACIEIFEGDGL